MKCIPCEHENLAPSLGGHGKVKHTLVILALGKWRQEELGVLLAGQLAYLASPRPVRDPVSKDKVGQGR